MGNYKGHSTPCSTGNDKGVITLTQSWEVFLFFLSNIIIRIIEMTCVGVYECAVFNECIRQPNMNLGGYLCCKEKWFQINNIALKSRLQKYTKPSSKHTSFFFFFLTNSLWLEQTQRKNILSKVSVSMKSTFQELDSQFRYLLSDNALFRESNAF